MNALFQELLKQVLGQMTPLLQPLLKTLVQKVVELLLKNLGGNATAPTGGGVFGLSTDYTPEQLALAIDRTVDDLVKS